MFAKIKDGVVVQVPYGFGDLMRENPGTSFPHSNVELLFPDTEAAVIGGCEVVSCRYELNLNYDHLQFMEGDFEAYQENGEWVAKQKLVPFTPEQRAERLAIHAIEMRVKRNQLLTASDWTQLPDALVDKVAWSAYRQALRDVPTQAGFPVNIQWPEQPK